MEPLAVFVAQGGEWMLIHRCKSCGQLHENRIAGDDSVMLLAIAAKPWQPAGAAGVPELTPAQGSGDPPSRC
jgi:hypothetical protein